MFNSKKVVLKLVDLHDDRDKQKAMKVASKTPGINLISMDMKEKQMTVIGDVDPVNIVNKLRKYWNTDIFSIGPAKELETSKGEIKKDVGGEKINATYTPHILPYYYPNNIVRYNPVSQTNFPQHVTTQNPFMARPYYSLEENSNGCVIC